jgi:hypothetical protein
MEELKEMWFPIAEAPDYYISNHGRVLSVKRGKPRFLKIGTNKWGYQHYTLTIDGRGKSFNVHRLVANYFVPNPDGLPQVDHIDQDKANNVATNLRWVTSKQNYWNQKNRQIGKFNGKAKLTEEDVKAIRARRKKGESSIAIALDYSISSSNVRRICLKTSWKHVD